MSNCIEPADHAQAGRAVFPVYGLDNRGRCTCRRGGECSSPGKHPKTTNGFKDAVTDLDQIERWWANDPNANVGWAIPEGVVVIDIDPRKRGHESIAEFRDRLPATASQTTGYDRPSKRSGEHLIYRLPDGMVVSNGTAVLPGVDLKTVGGYIVVAPSRHSSGVAYTWRDAPIAELPQDVLSDLLAARDSASDGSIQPEGSDLSEVIAGLPEGERDQGLFRACCRWRRKGLERAEVEALALVAADRCTPPFPHDEAMVKVAQAFAQDHDDVGPWMVEWAQSADKIKPRSILDAMRSALLSPDDLELLPDPEWLIDGILPKSSMSVLYGQPGLGKTFLALDWALRVGGGLSWLDREVKTGSVLYVYAEGVYGLKNRRAAWVKSTGLLGPLDVRFFPRAVPLLDDDWVAALTDLCRELQPTLVVFDTLARATAGGDENSAKDMGRAVAACDAVRDATGAAVMLVHHTGKDGLNYRGSSAIEGAADTMLHLVRMDSGYLELRCAKQKEAEQFDPIPLQLESNGPSAVIAAAPSVAGFVETQATAQLVAILQRHAQTWLATASIADEAGIRVKKTAQRRLDALWEAGQIDRRDTGKGYQYRAKWTP